MMNSDLNPGDITVCVVGLGLMGCSITTCLLMAGHRVIALAPIPSVYQDGSSRISNHLVKVS